MFPWPSLLSRSKKGAGNFPQGERNFVPLMNWAQFCARYQPVQIWTRPISPILAALALPEISGTPCVKFDLPFYIARSCDNPILENAKLRCP